MRRHRTTALLLSIVAALAAGVARAQPPKPRAVPPLIFPVVGAAAYSDDFGDPRGQGSHEGNDIVAPRRAIAVAPEAGTIKFHATSSRAGCMIYLQGDSGTSYRYIHLNNDLGAGNDNRGSCVAGVAYAPGLKSGARVAAGEPVGYVGDSGDADGASAHLHFEVHPGDAAAVSPYPYLQAARKLLFAARPGSTFTMALRGSVVKVGGDGVLTLRLDGIRTWPGGRRTAQSGRTVEIAVSPSAAFTDSADPLLKPVGPKVARRGQRAVVWTQPAPVTLSAQLGEPFALTAERVELS